MVVVEMNLTDPGTEGVHPLFNAGSGKGVAVTGVKAEADITCPGESLQEKTERLRTPLIDILDCDFRSRFIDHLQDITPCLPAVFQPLLFMGNIVLFIEGGVTNHGPGAKKRDQIKGLSESFHRHLPYLPVYGTGSQIEEGGMQRNGQTRAAEGIRHITEFTSAETVEDKTIQADLRVDSFFQDQVKVPVNQHLKGHIYLDFSQYIAHIQNILIPVSNIA